MRKELITFLVAVLLFAPQAEATNAIGRSAFANGLDAIVIGRDLSAEREQIRIGDSQTNVWVGIYSLNALANAAGFDAQAEYERRQLEEKEDEDDGMGSPPRLPEPRRPAIQSGIDTASLPTVRGAEAVTPIAPAGGVGIGTGVRATNAGIMSSAQGSDSVAFGHSALAASAATAIGSNTNAGTDGVAIGYNAEADGSGGVAIGVNSLAQGGGGIAIGHGVKLGRNDDIAIGEASDRNVRIGAYDFRAMNATIDTNTRDIADHEDRLGFVESELGKFQRSDKRYNKGIAMAMAQGALYVEPGKRATVGLSHAGYRGEHGMAASFGVRVNEQIQVHFSGATDTGFDEKGIKSGIQFSW
ncbi:MAG: YadA-like family protein [Candidatus Dadabacteria bacterium]|nr:YadA-like family protein [Candidatus Dadabacteria bacterium]